MKFLKDFGKTPHVFRDPIYGFIKLNNSELEIIDTPLFQRLRRISQLALTKYVYPCAEHSRFAHSLGVLHTATNFFINIYKKSDKSLFPTASEDIARHLKILRFAALLHDIGHLPFSHAAEKVFFKHDITHEELSQFIIEKYSPITDIITKSGVKPKDVSNILGESPPTELLKILKKIISGQLDADRADYLLRDSYSCGVKYGEYDYHRYVNSFLLKKNEKDMLQLCIEEKNIYVIESFLMARYHYNLQVPFHRTRAGYDIILKKYIETSKEEKEFIEYDENNIAKLHEDVFELFDDYKIFEKIKIDSQKNNIWAKMLMRQGHITPIFDHIDTDRISANKDNELYNRYKYMLKGLKDKKLKENEDFFRYEKKVEISKLLEQVHNKDDDTDKKKLYNLGVIGNENEPEDILKYSNILNQLKKPIMILRIYILNQHKELGAKIKDEAYNHFKELKEV
ncbi:MAG: HD domain-containing protein [Deltaproteobacteria bacterium]|nr:HD domain-containing protein [Deltaproteobacteria bacterium]